MDTSTSTDSSAKIHTGAPDPECGQCAETSECPIHVVKPLTMAEQKDMLIDFVLANHVWAELHHRQNETCRLCPAPLTSPAYVDDNRLTGEPRAILCSACHIDLENYRASADKMSRIARYLDTEATEKPWFIGGVYFA